MKEMIESLIWKNIFSHIYILSYECHILFVYDLTDEHHEPIFFVLNAIGDPQTFCLLEEHYVQDKFLPRKNIEEH